MIDVHRDVVVATIPVGNHPYCATSNADGSRIYVTNTQSDTVLVIESKTQKVIATIKVGGTPEGISYDIQHDRIYVASWMNNELTVIDAKTNQVIKHIPTSKESRAFGQFIASPSTP